MEDKASAGDTAVQAAETAPAKKSSKTKTAAKPPKKKPSRPSTSEMVTTAIRELKDRKGSSLQAIKKYIVANYAVDAEKLAPFIKRYLKSAVTSGTVVQTKGKGASGSFKLSEKQPKTKSPKTRSPRTAASSPETKKAASPSKRSKYIWLQKSRKPSTMKKGATKAAESPKKQPAPKKSPTKPPAEKKPAKKAAPAKAQSKAKKTAKAPAAKTKSPKPKKTTAKTTKAAAKK